MLSHRQSCFCTTSAALHDVRTPTRLEVTQRYPVTNNVFFCCVHGACLGISHKRSPSSIFTRTILAWSRHRTFDEVPTSLASTCQRTNANHHALAKLLTSVKRTTVFPKCKYPHLFFFLKTARGDHRELRACRSRHQSLSCLNITNKQSFRRDNAVLLQGQLPPTSHRNSNENVQSHSCVRTETNLQRTAVAILARAILAQGVVACARSPVFFGSVQPWYQIGA